MAGLCTSRSAVEPIVVLICRDPRGVRPCRRAVASLKDPICRGCTDGVARRARRRGTARHTLYRVADHTWDGTTRRASLSGWAAAARERLADAAKRYDWSAVFDLLRQHPESVNSSRPGGRSWYAPLHQAAHGGASLGVVDRLIAAGAWRALRTAAGERPADIARRRGHLHLLDILEPPQLVDVPLRVLQDIQVHFHAVIFERARELVEEHRLRLPELEVMLELDRPQMWFPVPGMYGGFSYRLDAQGADSRLISDSWCRVVEGSEQRHEITAHGTTQVEFPGGQGGFVLIDDPDDA